MKKQIFDLLDHDPADIDEYLIEPVYDIDPEKIKGKIHTCLNERENSLYSIRKRRRFPVLLAAAVAVVLLIGGGIVACASLYVSPEDEMQRKLTEDFEARVKAIYCDKDRLDEVCEKYKIPNKITNNPLDLMAIDGFVRQEVRVDERKKVIDIVNHYLDDKYIDFTDYNDDVFKHRTIEEYALYYSFIYDCCVVSQLDCLTLEEKMMLLNYLEDASWDLDDGFFNNEEDMIIQHIEKRYPDYYSLWGKAASAVNKILADVRFLEKYGHGYFSCGRSYSVVLTQESSRLKEQSLKRMEEESLRKKENTVNSENDDEVTEETVMETE